MLHELVVEGKVVNPEGIHDAQISIDAGVITALKKQGLRGEREIEAPGCFIFPGFIDLHVHLREDGSHQWDYKEDFTSGTAAALHGGVTTVVDMPNTPAPGITAARLREKRELARKKSKDAIDILFYGAVTGANLTELAAMRKEAVAYKIYLAETGGLHIDAETLPKALKAVDATGNPVVIHCEDQQIIDKRLEEAKTIEWWEDNQKELHSELRPPEAELSAVKHVLAAASASPGTKINIAHASMYDTVGLIRAYGNIHCEVTPHHLFFTRDDVAARKSFLKTNPPLRTEANRRQLLTAFTEGSVDFLATDHAPHTTAEKARDLFDAPAGVPHLDTYGNFVAWLIEHCNVHPALIARVCADNPARFLGLNDRGRIEEGKRANLTVLDVQRHVKISRDHVYTKCGWSPFEGYEFPGTVRHTISKGVVMTDYDEVLF